MGSSERATGTRLWRCAVVAAVGIAACADATDDTSTNDSHLEANANADTPDDATRAIIVEKKATCPFVGTAVALKKLIVLGIERPLAQVLGTGSVAELGDTGGGDLGTKVLTFFARGNHHFMLGPQQSPVNPDAKLDTAVPPGTFSLDFPGSQGSHPGHSGILEDDSKGAPTTLASGGFSRAAFERLTAHAESANGADVIRCTEVGKYIAENLIRDTRSKVVGNTVANMLASDVGGDLSAFASLTHEELHQRLNSKADTPEADRLYEALTKTLGEDNLVGSSGEFGLLFAFLARSPNTVHFGLAPAIAVDDLTPMFGAAGVRTFPRGWETWKKTKFDWTVSTICLSHAALQQYIALCNDSSVTKPEGACKGL
jgi:hypothetical protein